VQGQGASVAVPRMALATVANWAWTSGLAEGTTALRHFDPFPPPRPDARRGEVPRTGFTNSGP
jgi:hypothetical protein